MRQTWIMGTGVLLIGLLFGSIRADMTGPEVIGRLQKKFDDLETLSARFVKRHYWQLMDQHQEIKGQLLVQRPNRFRFESNAQTIVSDGKTAWNYAPANEQVLVSDYETVEKDRSYEKLLFDLILLGGYAESFESQYIGEERIDRKSCHVVELVTRQEDAYIHKIRLWVDNRMWVVRQVEYRNIHDDVTTFGLSDIKVDKKVAANRFAFRVPKGVELIDLR